jgi:hypothetical protein
MLLGFSSFLPLKLSCRLAQAFFSLKLKLKLRVVDFFDLCSEKQVLQ